ncbi:hypothetical protein Pcinc_025244 [Petrolisthes cinctipes]|uniref:Uncharacterized protein n=1 Tax=Petrolisthes cinctipes TaxID=88211 RepID=A0AAE1F8V9_PETCI|nr:hypothetical protein Pcinc_025244 [Petrolisthes cinctipes]
MTLMLVFVTSPAGVIDQFRKHDTTSISSTSSFSSFTPITTTIIIIPPLPPSTSPTLTTTTTTTILPFTTSTNHHLQDIALSIPTFYSPPPLTASSPHTRPSPFITSPLPPYTHP